MNKSGTLPPNSAVIGFFYLICEVIQKGIVDACVPVENLRHITFFGAYLESENKN